MRPAQKHFEHVDPPLVRYDIVSRDTPEGRIYTGPDGTEYWSMTTMLGMTGDDSWLVEWEKRLGPEAAEIERQRCCDRGEMIHLATEQYINNEPFEKCRQTSGKYFRMFSQLKRVVDSNITKVYATELPVFSKMMKVGGRLDLLADWNHELAIIDYKGSNSLKTRQDIEDYSHQLCGYSLAVEELYGLKPKKLVNIISNEKSLVASVIKFNRGDVVSGFADRIRRFHALLNNT